MTSLFCCWLHTKHSESLTAIKLILLHGRSDDCIQSCLARVYQHLKLMLSSVVATERDHAHQSRSAAHVRRPETSGIDGQWEGNRKTEEGDEKNGLRATLPNAYYSVTREPRTFFEVDGRPWEMWLCWPICSKWTRKPLHQLSPNTSSTCKMWFVISVCSTPDARLLLLPPPFFSCCIVKPLTCEQTMKAHGIIPLSFGILDGHLEWSDKRVCSTEEISKRGETLA